MVRLLPLVLLAACEASPPSVDGGDSTPAVDPTAAVFDAERLLEVEIDLPATDWETLRHQGRSLFDLLGDDCLGGPRQSPFNYFAATVTIDGTEVPSVGVRKKGFLGSLSETKPSLKVKFHEYVDGQTWEGMKRLTLNNAKQDPAYVKQCLGYQLFADAGLPAPRCNFAHVRVNGEDLGLYVHVESIKKAFLARQFNDDSGNLYEGALSDFRPEWINTFERKTNKASVDASDLQAVMTALEASDEELVDSLAPLIDLDAFYAFWAAEVLIGHWDGYAGNTNNFYVYFDPASERAHFIPWGIDGVMFPADQGRATDAVAAQGVLAWRLINIPESRDAYGLSLRGQVEDLWNETALTAELDRMESLITPVADPDGSLGLTSQIAEVQRFVDERRDLLLDQLDAGPLSWSEPLRDPPCFSTVAEVNGDFATTWASFGLDPFDAGSGTFVGLVEGAAPDVGAVGSVAGFDTNPESAGLPLIYVTVFVNDGHVLLLIFQLGSADLLLPSTVVSFDWTSAFGVLVRYFPATDESDVLGFVGDGTLTLDAASAVDGEPLAGSFDVTVIETGW